MMKSESTDKVKRLVRKGVGTEDHPWPCSQVGAIGKAIEANFERERKRRNCPKKGPNANGMINFFNVLVRKESFFRNQTNCSNSYSYIT